MNDKKKRLEENLDKLEEIRLSKIMKREFERDRKLENVSRMKRSLDYQNYVKKEKIKEEEDKIEEMKYQLESFKESRVNLKNQLLNDIELLKSGSIQIESLKARYMDSLRREGESEHNLTMYPNVSRKSEKSSSPIKGLNKISKTILQKGVVRKHMEEERKEMLSELPSINQKRNSIGMSIYSSNSKMLEIPGFTDPRSKKTSFRTCHSEED